MNRLSGKTALITGAASGIGLATARRFLAEGAHVVAADLTPGISEADRHLPLKLDVTSETDWADGIVAAEARFGRLDILVNNAGIGTPAPLESLSLRDWRRVLAVDLDGVFLGIRHAIPALRRAGGGVIINIASVLGSVAVANASAYCAAKSGVLGLTRAAALELAADGIRVVAVQPGYIETPLLAGRLAQDPSRRDRLVRQTPAGRLGTAEEVAGLLVYLATDEASFVSGNGILIDGGYTAQ